MSFLSKFLPKKQEVDPYADDDDDDAFDGGGGGAGEDEESFEDLDDDGDDIDFGDDAFDEEDENDETPGTGRRKKLIAAAAAGLVLLAAGGGWWWMSAPSSDEPPADDPFRASLMLPAPGEASGGEDGALSPPRERRSLNDLVDGGPASGSPSAPGTPGGAVEAAGGANGLPGVASEAGVVVPPTTPASFAGMSPIKGEPLGAAPVKALVEPSSDGPLPKVGADGTKPWQAYARPFNPRDDRPRIAVIVSGLGMSDELTRGALTYLPPGVTVAFSPYGAGLDRWVPMARDGGHEVMLSLPMEPLSYPLSDPGPLALMLSQSTEENVRTLYSVMGKAEGYVGMVGEMGDRFTLDEAKLKPVIEVFANRGLIFVDPRTNPQSKAFQVATALEAPRAMVNLHFTADMSREEIDDQLRRLENAAKNAMVAVAVAEPTPAVVARIAAWAEELEKRNMVLAPLSAVVNRQFL